VSATTTSLIICALLIGGALSGVLLRRLLPDSHLDTHAKDIVRLGCALIATITGLVLGLLINSGKNSFDAQRDDIRLLTAKIEMLDYLLDEYGPQARPARAELRKVLPDMIDRIWDDGTTKQNKRFAATAVGHTTYQMVAALSPTTEAERAIRSQALELANTILQTRLILLLDDGLRDLLVAFHPAGNRRSVYPSRTDGADAGALNSVLQRGAAGEADHAVFRRRVGRTAGKRIAAQAIDRGIVHDHAGA